MTKISNVCKDYECLPFANIIAKNIAKNISKILSGKYSQNFIDHAKESAPDALKTTSKRLTQKTFEAAGDLILNKIPSKISKVSKNSQQNNSKTVKMSMKKKLLLKDIYLHKKDRKLLMI